MMNPAQYRAFWESITDVPFGFCLCGCQQPTSLAKSNHEKHKWVKGEPVRYILGHKRNHRKQTVFPGDTFGRLVVLEYIKSGRHARARCICTCGNIKDIRVDHLVAKGRYTTRSCGCIKSETVTAQNKSRATHGHSTPQDGLVRSPTYTTWLAMNIRCHQCDEGCSPDCSYPKTSGWKHYGGRQPNPVTVCEEWRFGTKDAFRNFLADMSERPDGMVIDRINGDLGYYPSNCRWVTQKVNIANRNLKNRSLSVA